MERIHSDYLRLSNIYNSIFPPRAEWSFADIPDLTGRVAIVTGGNAGIGKVMCRELLAHGATVYMFCRSPSKAASAIQELKSSTGKSSIETIVCDLASLSSVRSAAKAFLDKEKELHLLFCSAGLGMPPEQVTKDGYDMTFGVNVLAHAYLVKLLLPTMQLTAGTSPPGTVRVVTTASTANNAAPKGGVSYNTLKPLSERASEYNASLAYYQSKWANVAYTYALVRHNPLPEGRKGVHFVSCDPGWIKTQIWDWQSPLSSKLTGWILADVEHGALTPLYAGVAQEVGNGAFLVPWAREGRARVDTEKEELQEELWDWVEEELKTQPGL